MMTWDGADDGRGSAGYLKEGKVDKREKVVGGKTWYCTGDRGIKDEDGYYWCAVWLASLPEDAHPSAQVCRPR